ncbi:MAG: SPFH domain-containing protein [Candidatus Xenobia bacterium]
MSFLTDFSLVSTYVHWGMILFALWLFKNSIYFIPNNKVGIKEKRWGPKRLESGIIACNGEVGYEPDLLRGGFHCLMPFQYNVYQIPLVTISQGQVGYIFARDGQPLTPMQTLATNETANDFQDVRAFLNNGGQRGPQRRILREGTYAINLAQFVVITQDLGPLYLRLNREDDASFQNMAQLIAEREGFKPLVITSDSVGVVTVHDGPGLPQGELIAPVVGEDADNKKTYHNSFQDPDRFQEAGGMRGRQLQVLLEGTYYINRLFATVEMVPKTVVEVGNVGVIVSYTGQTGRDISGADYKHGELVTKGDRGVWDSGLLPGKYALNTYACKVIMVPTTNFILKWCKGESGAHRFDENLSEISLITKDAFEPFLPLSVVVHIDYLKAPRVIQRFGDIKKLVDQTLDPMVAAYFKNIAQTRTLIQLIQDRASIQNTSVDEMREKFAQYDLELQEVLIGTPTSGDADKRIEDILTQLRARQIAEEQIETYGQQEKAAVKERELREAEARAKQQHQLTESELSITVQSNSGKAEYQRSLQEASKMRALAEAEGAKVRTLAEAEADKIKMLAGAEAEKATRIGIAQAIAIEEQVRAYGGPKFQLTQQVMNRFAEAVEKSRVDVVPRMLISGSGGTSGPGGNATSGSMFEALLAIMLNDKSMGSDMLVPSAMARDPQIEALRDEIKKNAAAKTTGGTPDGRI